MSLLEVRNLKTYFYTDAGVGKAVDDVSFSLDRGKTLGIVGESGCGKSVTSLSIMRLVDPVTGRYEGGEILFDGKDILKLPEKEMQQLRGNRLSMIFQEPMTSLNPVFTVGFQISESLMLHKGMDKKQARARAIELLEMVGVPEPARRVDEYPHQLSGGMRQRVMIAMALSGDPELLIADEPTTALDVTIQAQILELLKTLQKQLNMSIIIITHDLGVIAEMADEVAVMYAGDIVEKAPMRALFDDPKHPYTIGLMESKPVINKTVDRLYSIPGAVPNPVNMPDYCYFRDRCERCVERCQGKYPPEIHVSDTHIVSCWRYFDDPKGGKDQ